MKYLVVFFIILFSNGLLVANDGAFYGKGNQLIPISETDIQLKKEILTIKKIRDQYMEVTVYYEFFNPKEEKKLTVGFEATSPSGDVDATPKNGQHPYMHDFTVQLNNTLISYSIAYVEDSVYVKNGIIKGKALKQIEEEISNANWVDFYYVYYFDAVFKKGLNTIKHTYTYTLSGSIDQSYNFEYVLTAANRWGNKQIDDFTLILDMGEFETFHVDKGFFSGSEDWLINGLGKSENVKGVKNTSIEKDALKFHIQKGNILFQKTNFKPADELFLYAKNYVGIEDLAYIPFSYYQEKHIQEPQSDFHKKVLKNLPFARRGYVFKDAGLRVYFEQMDWYLPNPNYIPTVEFLTDTEKRWVERWN